MPQGGCPPSDQKGKGGRAHRIHGMASTSTVARIMYQKYFNGMPLYRQERDWKQCGANISRTTFANWIIANAQDFFTPMYAYFRKKLLARSFAMADETPVQVLHEPGRARRHSPICGCSAVVKMRVRQSSFINTLQRALETMPWNSWKGTADT